MGYHLAIVADLFLAQENGTCGARGPTNLMTLSTKPSNGSPAIY